VRPSRFTDKQVLAALAEVRSGTPAIQVCRRLGITQTTFYRWRRRNVSALTGDKKEIQLLRDENRKLKEIVTKLMLDKV
jgi:putative transposase